MGSNATGDALVKRCSETEMPRFPFFSSLPLVSGTTIETGGVTESSTSLTSLTPTANAWPSSWTQLLASTSNQCFFLIVCCEYAAGYATRVEIGVGASGSESAICDVTFYDASTVAQTAQYAYFMVNIEAGSRVSARAAATSSSGSVKVGVWLVEVIT